MRLGPKLIAPQLLVLGLIVAVALVQAWLSSAEHRVLEQTTAQLEKVAAQIQRLNQLFADSERDVLSHYIGPQPLQEVRLREAQREATELLEQVRRADWSPRGAALAEDLRIAYQSLSAAQRQFLEKGPEDPAQVRQAFVRWWFVAQRTNAMLADLSAYNMRRLNGALANTGAIRRLGGQIILGLTVTAALLGLGFALWVARQVLRPIAMLTAASQRIGEPGQRVPRLEGRRDELGTLVSTLADMTDRLTRSKAQLEEALSARDQFLSVAAHELKTPLTSLQLQLQLVERKLGTAMQDPSVARSTSSLGRQIARIAQLVDELLDVTRIRAGRLDLHLERVRLAPEIEEVALHCEPLLSRAGCRLTLALDPEAEAEVDRSRLEQLLVNVLGNAARHAPGSEVHLSLAREGAQVALRVKDAGPGLPEEVRARLFERFAHATGARPRPGSGLGLGLYISQQIVLAMGGTIEARSEPGQGTEFVVRLPST